MGDMKQIPRVWGGIRLVVGLFVMRFIARKGFQSEDSKMRLNRYVKIKSYAAIVCDTLVCRRQGTMLM